jgi:hypothetical protein
MVSTRFNCKTESIASQASQLPPAQRLSKPRTLIHTGIPSPIQLKMSHAPSPSSALNNPVTLTSPMASGMENTFQKFD